MAVIGGTLESPNKLRVEIVNYLTDRNRAYELMNAQQESIEPDKDILDEYKTQVQSIISNLNNEVANLKSDVLILKHEVVNLKQGIKNGI